MDAAAWTGGSMVPADAIEKLRADGYPVADFDPEPAAPIPVLRQEPGAYYFDAVDRLTRDLGVWRRARVEQLIAPVAGAVLRLIVGHAERTAARVEWRDDLDPERALLDLCDRYTRLMPASDCACLFGTKAHLAPMLPQATRSPEGPAAAARFESIVAARPVAYMSFASVYLGFYVVDIALPLIVAHRAYATGYYIEPETARLSVGVMPTQFVPGIMGATVAQLAAAAPPAEETPDFNPTTFRDRLRLRRKLAGTE